MPADEPARAASYGDSKRIRQAPNSGSGYGRHSQHLRCSAVAQQSRPKPTMSKAHRAIPSSPSDLVARSQTSFLPAPRDHRFCESHRSARQRHGGDRESSEGKPYPRRAPLLSLKYRGIAPLAVTSFYRWRASPITIPIGQRKVPRCSSTPKEPLLLRAPYFGPLPFSPWRGGQYRQRTTLARSSRNRARSDSSRASSPSTPYKHHKRQRRHSTFGLPIPDYPVVTVPKGSLLQDTRTRRNQRNGRWTIKMNSRT